MLIHPEMVNGVEQLLTREKVPFKVTVSDIQVSLLYSGQYQVDNSEAVSGSKELVKNKNLQDITKIYCFQETYR